MEAAYGGADRLNPDPTQEHPALLRLETTLRRTGTRGGGNRHAAVAMALLPRLDDLEILVIRRTERPDDPWSGQMALPGGRWEPHDDDARATAIRETVEEVGIDLAEQARWLGCLPAVRAVAKGRFLPFSITPVVFALEKGQPPLKPDPVEVAGTIWVSLATLRSGSCDTTVPWPVKGKKVLQLRGWKVEGEVIWGLTHRMIEKLLKRIAL